MRLSSAPLAGEMRGEKRLVRLLEREQRAREQLATRWADGYPGSSRRRQLNKRTVRYSHLTLRLLPVDSDRYRCRGCREAAREPFRTELSDAGAHEVMTQQKSTQ